MIAIPREPRDAGRVTAEVAVPPSAGLLVTCALDADEDDLAQGEIRFGAEYFDNGTWRTLVAGVYDAARGVAGGRGLVSPWVGRDGAFGSAPLRAFLESDRSRRVGLRVEHEASPVAQAETPRSPAFQAAAVSTGGNISEISFALNAGSADDRFVALGASLGHEGAARTVVAASYAGQACEFEAGVTNVGTWRFRAETWWRAPAASGTNQVSATFDATTNEVVVGAVALSNVAQTNPVRSFATNTGLGSNATVTLLGVEADDLLVGALCVDSRVPTPGANQTGRWSARFPAAGDFYTRGAGSTRPGSTGATSSWTWSGTWRWAVAAMAVREAGAPDQPSVTAAQGFAGGSAELEGSAMSGGTPPHDASRWRIRRVP